MERVTEPEGRFAALALSDGPIGFTVGTAPFEVLLSMAIRRASIEVRCVPETSVRGWSRKQVLARACQSGGSPRVGDRLGAGPDDVGGAVRAGVEAVAAAGELCGFVVRRPGDSRASADETPCLWR